MAGAPTSGQASIAGYGSSIAPDEVTHRRDDRAVRSGDGRLQLVRAQRNASVNNSERRPHVMAECVLQHGLAHVATIAGIALDTLISSVAHT